MATSVDSKHLFELACEHNSFVCAGLCIMIVCIIRSTFEFVPIVTRLERYLIVVYIIECICIELYIYILYVGWLASQDARTTALLSSPKSY